MASKRISELPAATALDGTEQIPITQGGETRRVGSGDFQLAHMVEVLAETTAGQGDADDSGALNTFLSGLAAGTTVFWGEADYNVQAQVSWTNKALHHVFHENARIVENAELSLPVLYGDNVDGSTLSFPHVEGIETEAGYDGTDSTRYGIKVDNSSEVVVIRPTVNNKSRGTALDNCTDSLIEQPRTNGFLTSSVAGANFVTGVEDLGGTNNKVTDPRANGVGNGLLGGSSTSKWVIQGGVTDTPWNNGAYISSGNDCSVLAHDVLDPDDGGVKVRGSRHTVAFCLVENAGGEGISYTGVGATADSFGANGHGTQVVHNIVNGTVGSGIGCSGQDGYRPRHCTVSFNELFNTASGGGTNAAIKGLANFGTYEGNIVEGCDGTESALLLTWINPGGTGSPARASGITIRNNKLTNIANRGIDADAWDEGAIVGNEADQMSGQRMIDSGDVSDSDIKHNVAHEDGKNILITGTGSSGNRIAGNYGDRPTNGSRSHVIQGSNHEVHLTDREDPESTIPAAIGSTWTRRDGGAGTTLYVKESGTGDTGWVAMVEKNAGTSTHSGDGSTVTFSIAHGLGVTPTTRSVWAESADAAGDKYVSSVDATNINVTFATAPASGTNNVVLGFEAAP